MIKYLFQRILWVLMVLLGVSLLTFLLIHSISGDPWDNYSNNLRAMQRVSVSDTAKLLLEQRFGLDLPLWRQYTRYMFGDLDETGHFFCGAICGNLGPSIRQGGRSVQDILFSPPTNRTFWESRFGYSIRLTLLGFASAVLAGIPLGIVSAMRAKSPLDRGISWGLAILVSIPNFVLGLLAIVFFASWLKLINVIPHWNNPQAWVVPVLVLAVVPMANLARITRASVLEAMSGDYVRTARAKGLTRRQTILFHVLRNALIPMVTFLGVTLIEVFAGSFIIENLFSFPGFGREYWLAVLALDYPMLIGLTLIYATGIVFANLLTEICYGWIDPRTRTAQEKSAV
jgi:oligopeptide transport system permease protein